MTIHTKQENVYVSTLTNGEIKYTIGSYAETLRAIAERIAIILDNKHYEDITFKNVAEYETPIANQITGIIEYYTSVPVQFQFVAIVTYNDNETETYLHDITVKAI